MPALCLDLILVERHEPCRVRLDDAGCPCIAYLTTRLSELADQIRGFHRVEDVQCFEAEIASRKLAVALVRFCDGPIVELVEFDRSDLTHSH